MWTPILQSIRKSTARSGAVLSLVFFAGALSVSTAQPPAPGGVAGPLVWRIAAGKAGGQIIWDDLLEPVPGKSAPVFSTPERWLNFHPMPVFMGARDALRLTLTGTGLEQSTFFAVHQPADTLTERIVWSAGAPGGEPLVLTTHRFADLTAIQYRNFVGMPKDQPGIKTYYQYKTEEGAPAAEKVLLIGAPPGSPDLPVQPFHGILPEVIVYDRVLSPAERTRVESYLALKYGLTLAADVDYLAAAGEVIWDASKNRSFHHRIAGIGRDDAGALLQKQATSSYQPGFPAIGVERIAATNAENAAILPDRTFLLWGDDGGDPGIGQKKFAQPRRLGRSWLLTTSGQAADLSTVVQFDLGRLAADRRPGETYWLLIDRTGTGRFPAGQVDYLPASGLAGRDIAEFRDIRWDTDGSGGDCFSVGIAQEFTGIAWLEEASCSPPAPGRMTVGAAGGLPPYRYLLEGSHREWGWQADSDGVRTIDDLSAGAYQLVIEDAAGAVFTDSLFFPNTDGPVSGLASHYTLVAGQPLLLTAAGDLTCRWEGPEGLSVSGASLEVNTPGVYRLTMERAGCRSQQTIRVEGAVPGPFRDVTLYPNPARSGQPFNLALTLGVPEEVTLTIQDAAGRRIRQERLAKDDYHFFGTNINGAGAYLISLQAGGTVRTLPLVVE